MDKHIHISCKHCRTSTVSRKTEPQLCLWTFHNLIVVLWLIKWYDQCVLYGNGTTVAFGDSFLKCSFYGDISTYSYFHIVIKGRVNSCFFYEPQKECQKKKVTGVIGMSNIMFCIPCLKETEHNTLYGHNNTTIRYTNQVQKLTFRHDTWVLFAITERPSETVASVIWW